MGVYSMFLLHLGPLSVYSPTARQSMCNNIQFGSKQNNCCIAIYETSEGEWLFGIEIEFSLGKFLVLLYILQSVANSSIDFTKPKNLFIALKLLQC